MKEALSLNFGAKSRWQTVLLDLICGTLAGLPVSIPSIGIFAWISIIPFALCTLKLIYREEKIKLRELYANGFLLFLGYMLVNFRWLLSMYPLQVTGFSRPTALFTVILAWIGISTLEALGVGAIIPLLYFLSKDGQGTPRLVCAPLAGMLWALFEWLQGFFWFGLPWARLSISQTGFLPMLQSASLFGSCFVTFLLVCVNFLFAFAILTSVRRIVPISVALVLLTANLSFGLISIYFDKGAERERVFVGVIQGNISTVDKWREEMLYDSLRIYTDLSRKAEDDGADIIIFPETVIPYKVEEYEWLESLVADIPQREGTLLFAGCFGGDGEDVSNVIRAYCGGEGGVNVYSKQRPVPFGEYVPMRSFITSLFPFVDDINILDRSVMPGLHSSTYHCDGEDVTAGFLICFDSIYDYLARESVKNGADILFVSTNDSWFGDSCGVRMHAAQAVLRAVENRRSVVRAANTGISLYVTPRGEIAYEIPPLEEGCFVCEAEVNTQRSLYTIIGNLFIYLSGVVILALSVIAIKRKILYNRENLPQ